MTIPYPQYPNPDILPTNILPPLEGTWYQGYPAPQEGSDTRDIFPQKGHGTSDQEGTWDRDAVPPCETDITFPLQWVKMGIPFMLAHHMCTDKCYLI